MVQWVCVIPPVGGCGPSNGWVWSLQWVGVVLPMGGCGHSNGWVWFFQWVGVVPPVGGCGPSSGWVWSLQLHLILLQKIIQFFHCKLPQSMQCPAFIPTFHCSLLVACRAFSSTEYHPALHHVFMLMFERLLGSAPFNEDPYLDHSHSESPAMRLSETLQVSMVCVTHVFLLFGGSLCVVLL